jgi:hypothetical protein
MTLRELGVWIDLQWRNLVDWFADGLSVLRSGDPGELTVGQAIFTVPFVIAIYKLYVTAFRSCSLLRFAVLRKATTLKSLEHEHQIDIEPRSLKQSALLLAYVICYFSMAVAGHAFIVEGGSWAILVFATAVVVLESAGEYPREVYRMIRRHKEMGHHHHN